MHRLRNPRGFTLLEILVALVILTLGLLGVAGLMAGIMQGNSFSNKVTTATTLAQDKLEDIRKLGFRGTPATDTTVTENYNSIAGYRFYKRVTSIDVGNPSANMKLATVTVFWDSDAHRVTATTYLGQ